LELKPEIADYFKDCCLVRLLEGTAPADLTITGLARALPHSWAEQERGIG
jgi:hypothetical protein